MFDALVHLKIFSNDGINLQVIKIMCNGAKPNLQII